ncbi:hypothetical protein WKW77_29395 [Variovorax ureilyticus]|uniref:Uncharacterized protein n=1 Tax=Variovorax ureilyticus TaxID=1836198 RepID=A0ABU8VNX4_9BURK
MNRATFMTAVSRTKRRDSDNAAAVEKRRWVTFASARSASSRIFVAHDHCPSELCCATICEPPSSEGHDEFTDLAHRLSSEIIDMPTCAAAEFRFDAKASLPGVLA